MRSAQYVLAAVLTIGCAASATAQTTTSGATTQPTLVGQTASHWLAAGFVGGSFDSQGDSPNIDSGSGGVSYGGELGYLWRGIVGAEFIADFAPTFDVRSVFVENNPKVRSYMANAIGALPLGTNGQVQPYLSGGWGAIAMSADILDSTGGSSTNHEARQGVNLGGGILAFASNRVGLRGDVRYYHASVDNTLTGDTAADQLTMSLLSGLHFWRANGGIAFRW